MATTEATPMSVPESRKLLIVEDDRDVREVLESFLTVEGYATDAVGNGQEALDYLRAATELPRLILLDLRMPVLDGWQFLRERAADPAVAGIPVVVVTALPRSGDPAGLGVAEIIAKPVDVATLVEKIDWHYCRPRRMRS
jgi:CheY-like chemotaxis protein